MLSGKYQSEQAELDEKIGQLQSAIAAESQNTADAEKWIALMKECVNLTELTAELLNTLVMEEGNRAKAHALAEKQKSLVNVFEIGEYQGFSC